MEKTYTSELYDWAGKDIVISIIEGHAHVKFKSRRHKGRTIVKGHHLKWSYEIDGLIFRDKWTGNREYLPLLENEWEEINAEAEKQQQFQIKSERFRLNGALIMEYSMKNSYYLIVGRLEEGQSFEDWITDYKRN